ncbi:MAG: hypothetical protein KDJ47_17075 [Hyphomicrobiaceae bacterium]|nr:hypothetical protein [Hyphomicrobiaceae bacterium]
MSNTKPSREQLQANAQKSLDFLERLYPNGPWCLARFPVEGGAPAVETFYPNTRAAALAWIEEWNGVENLYFHINKVRRPMTKKAEKTDMESACYLHVDIDASAPINIMPLDKQLANTMAKFDKFTPKPTVVIMSGGGHWGLWKLEDPIMLDSDEARAEVEAFNAAIRDAFRDEGGDSCQNIDRIARLPWSENLPSFKKRKAGREQATAVIMEEEWDRTYSLSDFAAVKAAAAPAKQPKKKGKAADPSAVIPTTRDRLKKIDDLGKWRVPKRYRELILNGHLNDDPEEVAAKRANTGKDPSRSEWLFDVVTGLMRYGVPMALIKGIIMDERFGISESVRELGADADRYANRQIERAYLEVGDTINVDEPDLQALHSTVLRLLLTSTAPLYLMSKVLVRISTTASEHVDPVTGRKVHPNTTEFAIVSRPYLLRVLSRLATFIKYVKGVTLTVPPNERCVSAVLDHPEEPALDGARFDPVVALSRVPTLTRNEPGYDPATGIFIAISDDDGFGDVPMQPTKEEALAALDVIRRPLREYDFPDPASAAVAVSGFICGYYRAQMRACPLHVWNALYPGSGKTKLGECAGVIALGTKPPSAAYKPFDEAENVKLIESSLLSGHSVFMFDNVEKAAFYITMLNSVLTNETHHFRVLGVHKDLDVSTRCLFMVTGNNVRIQGDLTDRTVVCTTVPLNADGTVCTNPSGKNHSFDPVIEVKRDRAKIVMAIMTVLRAYIAAGEPKPDGFRPMRSGTFDDYDRVRGALIWLGMEDPYMSAQEIEDPDAAAKARVMIELFRAFRDETFRWNDILDRADLAVRALAELSHPRGELVPRAAQMALGGLVDKPFEGVTLKKKLHMKVNQYWFEGTPSADLAAEVKARAPSLKRQIEEGIPF